MWSQSKILQKNRDNSHFYSEKKEMYTENKSIFETKMIKRWLICQEFFLYDSRLLFSKNIKMKGKKKKRETHWLLVFTRYYKYKQAFPIWYIENEKENDSAIRSRLTFDTRFRSRKSQLLALLLLQWNIFPLVFTNKL